MKLKSEPDLPAILRGAIEATGDKALVRGAEEAIGDAILSVDFFEKGEDDRLRNELRLRRGESDKLALRLLDLCRRFFRSRLSLLERLFLSFLCLVRYRFKILSFVYKPCGITCLCCDASCDDGAGISPESGYVCLICSGYDCVFGFDFCFVRVFCSDCAFCIEHNSCSDSYEFFFLY